MTCPILAAPAMNNEMWAKPAVQRNVRQLQADGVTLIGPDEGWLSCQNDRSRSHVRTRRDSGSLPAATGRFVGEPR